MFVIIAPGFCNAPPRPGSLRDTIVTLPIQTSRAMRERVSSLAP